MNNKNNEKTKIMEDEYPENMIGEKLENSNGLNIGKVHKREFLIRQARAKLVKKAQNEFSILMQELMDSSDEEK